MARIDRALLTILGVLITHEGAYLASSFAGYENAVSHGHFKTAWLLGSVAALAALTRAVVKSLRRRNHEPGNPIALAAWIGSGYALLEQIERLADGYGALTLFSEPVLWLGLALAPLVALFLARSLHTVEEIAGRLTPSELVPCAVRCVISTLGASPQLAFSPVRLSSSVTERGPPVGAVFP